MVLKTRYLREEATFVAMKLFGLIGYPLEHSLSQAYFTRKFAELGLDNHVYRNFPMAHIQDFPALISANPDLQGLNVTIPYKMQILPYLDALAPDAREIGAVNTICFRDGARIGHNTDWLGFKESVRPIIDGREPKPSALVLGSGGASRAVAFALRTMGIPYRIVSRTRREEYVSYQELTDQMISGSLLIINTTPLGMHPHQAETPDLNFEVIGTRHVLVDLIYNPEKTAFLIKGEERGAVIKNGLDMLYLQADAAWQLWNMPYQE